MKAMEKTGVLVLEEKLQRTGYDRTHPIRLGIGTDTSMGLTVDEARDIIRRLTDAVAEVEF